MRDMNDTNRENTPPSVPETKGGHCSLAQAQALDRQRRRYRVRLIDLTGRDGLRSPTYLSWQFSGRALLSRREAAVIRRIIAEVRASQAALAVRGC